MRQAAGRDQAEADAGQGQLHTARHEHPYHVALVSAERHPEADLRSALGDGVRQQTIQADAGQQQRQHAEAGDEVREQPLRGERRGQVLVQRLDVVDGQIAVERPDFACEARR